MKMEIAVQGEEQYLNDVFLMMQKVESLAVVDKKTRFNNTEMRLIREILVAKSIGERLISTRLANILGLTRSAISQIVNRLEKEGVVARVPDAVDRKIAYIEITDEIMDTYGEELRACTSFVERGVEKFGAEKFKQMCALVNGFCDVVKEEGAAFEKKRKYNKK